MKAELDAPGESSRFRAQRALGRQRRSKASGRSLRMYVLAASFPC